MQAAFSNTRKDRYRFTFNGMEGDDEVKGTGNSFTTEFRQYDPRLGRWLSIDPVSMKYPELSPYAFAFNNPIWNNDPNGDDPPPHPNEINARVLTPALEAQILRDGHKLDYVSEYHGSTKFEVQDANDVIVSNGHSFFRVLYDPSKNHYADKTQQIGTYVWQSGRKKTFYSSSPSTGATDILDPVLYLGQIQEQVSNQLVDMGSTEDVENLMTSQRTTINIELVISPIDDSPEMRKNMKGIIKSGDANINLSYQIDPNKATGELDVSATVETTIFE